MAQRQTASIMIAVTIVVASFACARKGSSGPVEQRRMSDIASGVIHVDLLADGDPVFYWQYAVIPSTGRVHPAAEKTFERGKEDIPQEFDRPTGATDCLKKPTAVSPNGQYVGRCQEAVSPTGAYSHSHSHTFIVENRIIGAEAFHWTMDERRRIRGFS